MSLGFLAFCMTMHPDGRISTLVVAFILDFWFVCLLAFILLETIAKNKWCRDWGLEGDACTYSWLFMRCGETLVLAPVVLALPAPTYQWAVRLYNKEKHVDSDEGTKVDPNSGFSYRPASVIRTQAGHEVRRHPTFGHKGGSEL